MGGAFEGGTPTSKDFMLDFFFEAIKYTCEDSLWIFYFEMKNVHFEELKLKNAVGQDF